MPVEAGGWAQALEVFGRSFPEQYSEILRREECKEEDGFVQGLDREGELWGRSMGQDGENGMYKAV